MKIKTMQDAMNFCNDVNKHGDTDGNLMPCVETYPGTRREVWTVVFAHRSSGLAELLRARKQGRKSVYGDDIPGSVREYFTNSKYGKFCSLSWRDLIAVNDSNIICRSYRFRGEHMLITCELQVDYPYPVNGISAFCEVGESGEGIRNFIPLPATAKFITDVLGDVVNAAKDAEIETGWVEDEEAW